MGAIRGGSTARPKEEGERRKEKGESIPSGATFHSPFAFRLSPYALLAGVCTAALPPVSSSGAARRAPTSSV